MRYHSSMESELLGAESGFADASDGTRIHWSAVGRGSPALVCCDGIGCDGFAWKYLVRDFVCSLVGLLENLLKKLRYENAG